MRNLFTFVEKAWGLRSSDLKGHSIVSTWNGRGCGGVLVVSMVAERVNGLDPADIPIC